MQEASTRRVRVRDEYEYMTLWPIAIECSRAGVRVDTLVPKTRQLTFRKLAAAVAVRGVSSAASGAAGMPVRWPRRPAAVSEAVVADAEPDLSCAGELEQPQKALIG